VRIAVLGSLEVDEGRTVLGPRDRVVLQALAARPGAELRPEALADALWGELLPDTWQKVIQGCIVRLRKALGADSIRTSPRGYRLVMHEDDVDHIHFERLLARARELLANGEPERARYLTGQARALWRGDPLVELADWAPGRVESERLVELWRNAEDLHAEAGLRTGRHQEVLDDALRMVAEQPMRERRWGLLARAQYQSGRTGDALETLHRAKASLVSELGLDPGPELEELERAILRQDPSLAQTPAPQVSSACPYLGLVAYDLADASAFFGREADVTACLQLLDDGGFLAVTGPSGGGKSSLVRAGVAAALQRDGRRVAIFTPGTQPLDALANVNPQAMDVLVVDQCEEALRLEIDARERAEFFDRLVEFARRPGRLLIVALRADRFGGLSKYPHFARMVERGLYLLGAMTEHELRLAIEGPAVQAGLRLESGLVDLLVREVQGEPAALPLLSHVLRQTWKRREGNTLTVQAYAATGGVREAVAQSAEGVFRALDGREQAMLRVLMLRLVAPDQGGNPVRTRVPRRSVAADAEHRRLLEQLLAARLLVSDGETVEIAHESLAVAWPRLRSWLDEDVDGLRIMRHLTVSAESWDELRRPESELYRGVRQARAQEWRRVTVPDLTPVEHEFLAASDALTQKVQRATEAEVRRERKANQRLRGGLAAVGVLLAVALLAAGIAITAANRAQKQSVAADSRLLGAEALLSPDLDRSLLLAVAGVRLHNSTDTRRNLLATMDRAPRLLRSVRTHRILAVAVNNRTGQLASAVEGGPVELRDGTALKQVVGSVPVLGQTIASSPDGRRFAVAERPERAVGDANAPAVELLDEHGARALGQLGGIPAARYAEDLQFSPNSQWLALALADSAGERPLDIAVWGLTSASAPKTVVEVGGQPNSPVASSDGRELYSVGGGMLRVTDLDGRAPPRLLGPSDLHVGVIGDTVALSPDGRRLAVAAGPGTVLVDTATLQPAMVLTGQRATDEFAFSRDGTRLASSGERILVWDISGDDPQELFRQDLRGAHVALSPDGRTLYAGQFIGLLSSFDLAGDRSFLKKQPGVPVARLARVVRFSPDGRKIGYVFGSPPALQVRDVATGRLGPVIEVDQPQRHFTDLAWSPDSTLVNVTTGDSRVATWDASTGRLVAAHQLAREEDPAARTAGAREGASFAAFTRDGKLLLVGSTKGRLHVLDARTLLPVRAPISVSQQASRGGSPDPIGGLEPSPDNHTVIAFVAQGPAQVVDITTGTVSEPLDVGVNQPSMTYSPDGRRLFVMTPAGEVGLLDAATHRWISQPTAAQPFAGYVIAFSADGAEVATIASGRVGRWDGRTGHFLGAASIADSDGGVAFAGNRSKLMVAGALGSVQAWDLDPRTWTRLACRMAGRDLTVSEWSAHLPDRHFRHVCPA
jgi:DNA-binding SARP family transcriptional activator/WD40 repeat protein/energy-coupling factor transporter ATP-binding protein EcfA2